ncbi:hypothetical protein EXN66_Car000185 [Channa argus]|uniref:Interleukin-11 n=1 Tax=Channa argus TaxID=215402 RepID=A0A6G1QXI3_CHAAH|nr:hypothetical protein EXN66_Car000185 [Channa argus]
MAAMWGLLGAGTSWENWRENWADRAGREEQVGGGTRKRGVTDDALVHVVFTTTFSLMSPKSITGLLHLLLLAELFVHTSTRPAQTPSLCGNFGSMIVYTQKLMSSSKGLHCLSDDEVNMYFPSMKNKLQDLPRIQHTAAHHGSMNVSESLSQLYLYTKSFKLHVDWLKTAKEQYSPACQSTEAINSNLRQLSNLLYSSIHQISAEVPQSMTPSFPNVSTAFDVLQVSVEIAERIQVFCDWSRRVLLHLNHMSRCPRH